LAVSTGNDDFRIIEKNPIYQDSLSILTASERQELAVIIQNLKKIPSDTGNYANHLKADVLPGLQMVGTS